MAAGPGRGGAAPPPPGARPARPGDGAPRRAAAPPQPPRARGPSAGGRRPRRGMGESGAVTAGGMGSFFPAGLGPGWIGPDPLVAARAFKGAPLLLDANGSLWILRADGADGAALQLVQARSSSGATAWRSADVLWPTACSAAGQDAKQLIVGRRASDWPSGTIVDLGVVRWLPRASAAAQPS